MTDIMPALGTHSAMKPQQLDHMFPGVPHDLFRPHRWRDDVVTLGTVPASYVSDVTDGLYNKPWKAQVNKLLRDGGHDLIFSLGQVVPHEVIGMANYNKNVFVGTGGQEGINESHFLSAVYGIEQTLGRANTPLRQILNHAQDEFCQALPLLYALTVDPADARWNVAHSRVLHRRRSRHLFSSRRVVASGQHHASRSRTAARGRLTSTPRNSRVRGLATRRFIGRVWRLPTEVG